MKAEPCYTDNYLDSLDFISNELQEEFNTLILNDEDAIIRD